MNGPQRVWFPVRHGLKALFAPPLFEHTDLVPSPDRLPCLGTVGVDDDVVRDVLAEAPLTVHRTDESVFVSLQRFRVRCVLEDEPLGLHRWHRLCNDLILQQQWAIDLERDAPADAGASRGLRNRLGDGFRQASRREILELAVSLQRHRCEIWRRWSVPQHSVGGQSGSWFVAGGGGVDCLIRCRRGRQRRCFGTSRIKRL
jgi:hypothetical protein